jgi:hypothetical protein
MKTLKIIISCVLLAASMNTYCAQYKIINNGKSAVAVKVELEKKAMFHGDSYKSGTLTVEKLNPGSSKVLTVRGKRNAAVIYLQPFVLGSAVPNPLKLSNANNKTQDKLNLNLKLGSDYTFVLTSQPDPKNPNNEIWTITQSK